jgi:hypothetical protein
MLGYSLQSAARQVGQTGCSSAWLERVVRDDEVAGSNPVTPITVNPCIRKGFIVLRLNLCSRSYDTFLRIYDTGSGARHRLVTSQTNRLFHAVRDRLTEGHGSYALHVNYVDERELLIRRNSRLIRRHSSPSIICLHPFISTTDVEPAQSPNGAVVSI